MRNGHWSLRLTPLLVIIFLICPALSSGEGSYPDVTYLNTEVTSTGEEYVVVRSAFEITGPPNKWYTVYFQLRLDADTSVKVKDEKGETAFLRSWGSIFTPENVQTARYTDCRIGLPTKQFASATNIPKGKRTVLWAICDVWDDDGKKYIGSGWDVRTPLIVTTNGSGKITKMETFNTQAFNPKKNNPFGGEIKGRGCELSLKHLKLKPGVTLCRVLGGKFEIFDVLVMGDRQADITTTDRGFFFEPIDSPQMAAELVKVGYPGAVIIKTAEQYQAIAKGLKAKGWRAEEHMKASAPPSYGLTVKGEPDLGYRISALMIDYTLTYDLGLRNIMYREFAVTPGGRIGITTETTWVRAPQSETGAPPGWTQPLPLDPRNYNEVLQPVLTAEGSESIPKVLLTEREAAVPCPAGEDVQSYSRDTENWPDYALK